ncbi:inosine/xanthosine triphosphatase [Candidatus Entotheonella palauensis]|uniref:Probable inosine/xanthosine triphosphatase n=1 Tax=Candidatus Entotheonella gemina TaxID=1429439 RepID=W4M3D0_9BACT|nr:inosine/xanthosine triphosphatase [Candidatus Entotheonella palauensis]ETX04824.1 MAG: inosine/xanthosine triphosphatase [Candidatus Entotheonella gemina]
MSKIVVASTNPVKMAATQRGFHRMFPDKTFHFEAVSVPSGVREQPLSSAETLQGAMQRTRAASECMPEAAYWVGIEGGVETDRHGVGAFAWIVVRSSEDIGQSRTGTFYLPPSVADLLGRGTELGEAMDTVFGTVDSKHAGGAIGLLSDNAVDRIQLYEQAVVLALVSFKNDGLYKPDRSGHDGTGK